MTTFPLFFIVLVGYLMLTWESHGHKNLREETGLSRQFSNTDAGKSGTKICRKFVICVNSNDCHKPTHSVAEARGQTTPLYLN